MAEFPSLHLFTDAFLADAGHLTDEELGRYMRLLILTWRTPKCRLPNDDEWIARKLSRTVSDFDKSFKPLIKEFFKTSGNWVFQKRLTEEFSYRKKHSKLQSERAKSRYNKDKHNCRGNATNGIAPQPLPFSSIQLASAQEICEEEILPSAWYDEAQAKGIPDEQIYKSWRRFKEKTSHPFQRKKWVGWVAKERVS